MTEIEQKRAEIAAILARSRRLIAESRAFSSQVELRRAETDKMLASHGLTREQVERMQFTREQKLAVNEELKLRGLPAIAEDDRDFDFDAATAELRGEALGDDVGSLDVVEDRRRKLGSLMQGIRL